MRRRWLVLLVGRARLGLGHRSELSRHRTLEGARVAALDAVARLREGPTGGARDYVVVIERDGDGVVVEEMAIDEAAAGGPPRAAGAPAPAPEPPAADDGAPDAEPDDGAPDAEPGDVTPDAEPEVTTAAPVAEEPPGEVPAEEPAAPKAEEPGGEDEEGDEAEGDEDAPEPEHQAEPVTGQHIVVPARYVPNEVARGLHDAAGRALPGSEPVPEELIRDWERKIARLEGRPPPGEEPGGAAEDEKD
jgi:hypothetical protein